MALVYGDYGLDGVKIKTPSTQKLETVYEERSRDTLEDGKEIVDYNRKRRTATWGFKAITGQELSGILGSTIDEFDTTKTYAVSLPGVSAQIEFNAHLEGGVAWELIVNNTDTLKKIYNVSELKLREV